MAATIRPSVSGAAILSAEEVRERNIIDALSKRVRVESKDKDKDKDKDKGGDRDRGKGEPPPLHIDIADVLEKLLAAQIEHMVASNPRGTPPPSEAHLRSLLAVSKLAPRDVAQRLAQRLDALCAYEYPEPMPQSNRKHGMGHSSVFIRENMMRDLSSLVGAMMMTLRSGRPQVAPPSATWHADTGNLARRGAAAYAFASASASALLRDEEDEDKDEDEGEGEGEDGAEAAIDLDVLELGVELGLALESESESEPEPTRRTKRTKRTNT